MTRWCAGPLSRCWALALLLALDLLVCIGMVLVLWVAEYW